MKKFIYLFFVFFLCAATTEWISIEEILGKRDVEVSYEGDLEKENLKEKEKEGSHKHFTFLPAVFGSQTIDLSVPFLWLKKSITIHKQFGKVAIFPLYLLHCQLKVFS